MGGDGCTNKRSKQKATGGEKKSVVREAVMSGLKARGVGGHSGGRAPEPEDDAVGGQEGAGKRFGTYKRLLRGQARAVEKRLDLGLSRKKPGMTIQKNDWRHEHRSQRGGRHGHRRRGQCLGGLGVGTYWRRAGGLNLKGPFYGYRSLQLGGGIRRKIKGTERGPAHQVAKLPGREQPHTGKREGAS